MRAALSRLARADIEEIWRSSVERWSVEQAQRYLRGIESAIRLIEENPEIGPRCDDIREGYRRHRSQSHVIFYRLTAERIEIVRILHGRMDFGRHL